VLEVAFPLLKQSMKATLTLPAKMFRQDDQMVGKKKKDLDPDRRQL
jgi:hypothetical protein